PLRVVVARPLHSAPRARNGSSTRRIGRFESDTSPTSVLPNGCAHSNPDSNRIVVPLLPQSSGLASRGCFNPKSPAPCTPTTPPHGTTTPCGFPALPIFTTCSPQATVIASPPFPMHLPSTNTRFAFTATGVVTTPVCACACACACACPCAGTCTDVVFIFVVSIFRAGQNAIPAASAIIAANATAHVQRRASARDCVVSSS